MFGFTVYSSIRDATSTGSIPFPAQNDSVDGGHAVVAVGYDDNKVVGKSKGAIRIRNSWGLNWGEQGYGWLPYTYIEAGLAVDWWSMVQMEYLTKIFEQE